MPDDMAPASGKDEPGQESASHSADSIEKKVEFVARALSFRGPVPPPEMLRQYDEIVPGSPERLFQQFEKHAEHKRAVEKRTLELEEKRLRWIREDQQADREEARRGQIISACLLIAALLTSFLIVAWTGGWEGSIVVVVYVVAQAVAHLAGRKRDAGEKES